MLENVEYARSRRFPEKLEQRLTTIFRLDGQTLEWRVSEINGTCFNAVLHALSVGTQKSNPSFRQSHVDRVVWVTVLSGLFMRLWSAKTPTDAVITES